MSIVVPEKFYIGFQKRDRLEGDYDYYRDDKDTRTKVEYLLGFATYYEENKKFEKRKDTITTWASGYRWAQDKDPVIPSKIMDNDLMEGFYIPEEIRRCGSWSGGNVLWRIADPRGFELEISSNNLAQIMEYCNVLKGGRIEGECKWGWDMKGGSKVVLLPEDSEPYQAGLRHTDAREQKITLKDVKMGDEIELLDGTKGIYLGKHNMLFRNHSTATNEDSFAPSFRGEYVREIKRRAAILVDDKKLYLVAEPKVAYVLKETPHAYSADLSVQKINTILKRENMSYSRNMLKPQGGFLYYSEKPIMAFVKKPKPTDFDLVFLPMEKTFSQLVALKKVNNYDREDPDGVVYTKNGDESRAMELGWRGYHGDLEKAKKGKAKLFRGEVRATEKTSGYYVPRHYLWEDKNYTEIPEDWKWVYPAIKFEDEIFPLIYLPEDE